MIADKLKESSADAPAIVEQTRISLARIETEVFENFESAAILETEWDNLAELTGSEIFMTFDWCRVWWKHYGKKRTLRIYTFRSNGMLVGIIPAFFEFIGIWPFYSGVIKIVGTDFTISEICLPIQTKFLPKIIEIFLNRISSDFKWDTISLGPLAGQYRDLGILYETCSKLPGKKYRTQLNSDKVQTYFELAPSWERYLGNLNKKERHEIERTYKLLCKTLNCKNDMQIKTAHADDLDAMFSSFVQMHQLQWQRIKKLGHFGDWPGAEAFHREVARAHIAHDRLRLFEVKAGQECLGYEYVYKCGSKYCNFLAARSLSEETAGISLGKITIGEMVKNAITENVNCIDSLQGKYEYKLRLGGKLFPIHKITIVKTDFMTYLRLGMFKLLAKAINLFYYKIWFCRIAKKLPFKRGPLWNIWIKTKELI